MCALNKHCFVVYLTFVLILHSFKSIILGKLGFDCGKLSKSNQWWIGEHSGETVPSIGHSTVLENWIHSLFYFKFGFVKNYTVFGVKCMSLKLWLCKKALKMSEPNHDISCAVFVYNVIRDCAV